MAKATKEVRAYRRGLEADDRDYYVPAQDAKGHSDRIWARVTPAHIRELHVILQSRKFPFRTVSDIVRWCVDRGIRELATREGRPSVLRQVDAVMEVLREDYYCESFTNLFEALSRSVNRHLANGAHGEARRVVAMTREHLAAMPDGYWRRRYLDELDRQFGHLLTGEGVKLELGGGDE
jgi:hypothetical protein